MNDIFSNSEITEKDKLLNHYYKGHLLDITVYLPQGPESRRATFYNLSYLLKIIITRFRARLLYTYLIPKCLSEMFVIFESMRKACFHSNKCLQENSFFSTLAIIVNPYMHDFFKGINLLQLIPIIFLVIPQICFISTLNINFKFNYLTCHLCMINKSLLKIGRLILISFIVICYVLSYSSLSSISTCLNTHNSLSQLSPYLQMYEFQ